MTRARADETPPIVGRRTIDISCDDCRAEPGEVCLAVPPLPVGLRFHKSRVAKNVKLTKEANARRRATRR